MMMEIRSGNELNPQRGRLFQMEARDMLSKHFNVEFHLDLPIKIGNPPKDHKFDLVSNDQRYVGECKNYSWTKSGNVPSAKMGFVNEAVFYLSHLPKSTKKFIAMRRDTRRKRDETLAEYYHRTYHHLLKDIPVIEIDIDANKLREIK